MGAFIKGLQFGIISSMIGNPFGHYNPFACSNPFCGGNFLPPMMNFGFNPFFNSFNSPLYNQRYFTPVLQEPVFSFNSGSNYNFNETYPSQSLTSSGYINPTQFFTSKPVVYNDDLMSNPWSSTIGDSFTRTTETKKPKTETKAALEKEVEKEEKTNSKEIEKSKTKKETPVAKEDKPKASEAQQGASKVQEKEKKEQKTTEKTESKVESKSKTTSAKKTLAAAAVSVSKTLTTALRKPTIKLPGKYDEKFEKMLYEFVLGEEGDKINPNEPTKDPKKKQISYHGVLQTTYDAYRDKKGLPRQSVAKMKPEERDRLYYEEYYKLSGADKIKDPKLALYVFDAAINMGVGATKSLLRESNYDADRFYMLRKQRYENIGGENLNVWLGRMKRGKNFAEEELC